MSEYDDPNRKIETAPLEPPEWCVPIEEEAWTEEYFAKQDCGEVLGTPPSYQYVLLSYQFDPIEQVEPIASFCQLGYAKLFQKWKEKIAPEYHYSIHKIIQNPHKPKELMK